MTATTSNPVVPFGDTSRADIYLPSAAHAKAVSPVVHVGDSRVTQTMSSREIAELVESRHDSVKRTIERLADRALVSFTPMVESSHEGAGARPMDVYLVGKRDSYVVVAQLSPEFTARLVDRWQELEAAAAHAIPQSFAEALRVAADQAEKLEIVEKRLARAAPAVEFVDRYVEAKGNKGFREVAKLLGANERDFRAFLSEQNIMYVLGGTWTAYANHIEAARFVVKTGKANEHAYSTTKFTPKGIQWIANEWAKHCAQAVPPTGGIEVAALADPAEARPASVEGKEATDG